MDEPIPTDIPRGYQAHYVADGAAYARMDVNGDNVVRRGVTYEHIPRISRPDFSSLVFGSMDFDQVVFDEKVTPHILPAHLQVWRDTKAVAKVPRADGKHEYTVVPRVADVTCAPIEDYADDRSSVGELEPRSVARQYSLMQFFHDSSVADKFKLSSRTIQVARRLALTNPAEAARFVQSKLPLDKIQHDVKVVAGDYARSKKKNISSVWEVTSQYPATTAVIDSLVIADRVFLYGPGPEKDAWFVRGPLKYLEEIQQLHNMVSRRGTAEPMFLLGMELVQLQIDIYNGVDFESPTIVDHVAPLGIGPVDSVSTSPVHSMSTTQALTLDSVKRNVRPVTSYQSSAVVASSVRLTNKHVLLNEHVIKQVADAMVDSRDFQLVRMVNRDLWIAKSKVDMELVGWKLRGPRVGETCVVMYNVGDRVEVTSTLRVVSFDGVNVFTTKVSELRDGVSGGALVSVDDASLFGVYSGLTPTRAVFNYFGQEHYSDMVDHDATSQTIRLSASGDAGDTIYSSMKDRGIHTYLDAAISSMRPLYDGELHVGMVVSDGKRYVTTVNPDEAQYDLGKRGRPLVFDKAGLVYHSSNVTLDSSDVPAVCRRPNPKEVVFVIGRDEESPYFSYKTRIVHVGSDSKDFSLADVTPSNFPFAGGLIIAESDAAVVGQFVGMKASVAMGEYAFCVAFRPFVPDTAETPVSQVLDERYPMLSAKTWPIHVIDEMLTHTSVCATVEDATDLNFRLLASIGDAALKLAMRTRMRDKSMLVADISKLETLHQSNSNMVNLSWQIGVAQYMRVGKGVNLPHSSKAYADLLESLCGVIYLFEGMDTLMQFAQIVGLVPQEDSEVNSPGL